MPAAATDAARQIAALAASAETLAQNGERETAEQVYRTILASAPYHVAALMFLAARALERGEPAESQRLLERAVESDSQRPAVYQNLGVVLHINGQRERALAAFDRALALKPVAPLTLLHKGTVLEELGQPDAALVCYRNGLGELPRKARELVADPTTPVKLRALIEHGMQFSRDRFEAVVSAHIAPVAERYGEPKLTRVRAAIRWLNGGAQAPAFAHALQRPDYLYVPGIEPRAFFEPAEFDWVPALEKNFRSVQQELRAVLERKRGIDPYVQIDPSTDPQQWRELNHSGAWNAFRLMHCGRVVAENSAQCPATMQALRPLPLPQIPGHAPEALFSLLAPGAHIPPHYGLGNYKLVVHLPLIVPPDCGIRVGHATRGWTEGKCLIFDDSFQHEAWNHSGQLRSVLITEIWNPLVTEAERAGITALVAALQEFNGGGNRARTLPH